jgi:hypothetical protein
MTQREARALGSLVFFALVIGLPLYFVHQLILAVGWPVLIGTSVALIVTYFVIAVAGRMATAGRLRAASEARRAELLRKYDNESIVERIMNGEVWQGQTEAQLHDALGSPVDVDERVLKSKTRRVWKYRPIGTRRFGLRITTENNVVVGWDDKS